MCAHYPPVPGSVFSFCWDFRLSLTSQGSVWWRDIEQSFTRRENSKSLSPSRPLHSSGAKYLFHSSLTFGAISSLIDYIGCILVLHTCVRGWCMLNNSFSATFSAFNICSRWSGKHIFYPTHTHRHVYELRQLSEELERYKELAVTYEQSISRKDHVIANLTRALQKQVA